MPITGRDPPECFRRFEDHVRKLVAATVTTRHPVQRRFVKGEPRMKLSFMEQQPIAVPIQTRLGRLYFYLGQALEAVEEVKRFRLRTCQYWYRIQHGPELTEKALLRWEYDTETPRDGHCRHHAQVPLQLSLGEGQLDLDNAHLPTGWVTMEEVIRFLIVDLEMPPPCGAEWPDVLQRSERAFFEQFTGKRHKPADSST
jgi:hypothetical protein